jgi:Reverse transcriptase (RNA-dependent DNA polymerase)
MAELGCIVPKFSRPLLYSIPKSWPARRVLSVPNPLHQLLLSNTVLKNWSALNTLFSKSSIALSTPTVFPDGKRAVSRQVNFDQWSVERLLRSASARFILRADLSRFYHTIYTHSLPWAIHSKETAKLNRSLDLFGNEIDLRVRNTQDQQTIGLPVGPDTSFILAEVLGAAIDERLMEEIPNLHGIRYVDDFTLYFETRAEADNCYATLSRIAKRYELEINERKTDIFEAPDTGEPHWKTALKSQRIQGKNEMQRSSLVSFISRCFELAKQFPGEGVISYAIKKVSGSKIDPANYDLYQAFLLSSVLHDSSVLPLVTAIAFKNQNEGLFAHAETLLETIYRLCKLHSSLGHSFEVSWALWLLRLLRVQIPDSIVSLVSRMDDPLVALISLDLRDIGLLDGVDTSQWERSMRAENLFAGQWLLAYEALKRGWLQSAEGNYLLSAQFFTVLDSLDVYFTSLPGREVLVSKPPGLWDIDQTDRGWLTQRLHEQ